MWWPRHFAIACPTKNKKFTLISVEDEIVADVEKNQKGENEETENSNDKDNILVVELEGSNIPMCVVCRILTSQKDTDEGEDTWLHTNISHAQVEHNGKSMNLIIDKGNEMNIVSQE